jgi:outer membrane protein assembly factor BamB
VFFVSFVAFVYPQEWPQWRGPGRDGVVASFKEPGAWPAQLKQEWQVNVGIGHSSPVVANSKVYVFTRQGEQEVVSCLDLATGRQIWRDACAAPYTMNPAATGHGKGPKSTPVLHAGRLCTFGISGILTCYEADTGARSSKRDMPPHLPSMAPRRRRLSTAVS